MISFENKNDRYAIVMTDAALKPKWRERFEFFDAHGAPSSPEFRAAFKALPFKKRLLINISWLGLFFGPFYFLWLGMWRRMLTLAGIAVAIAAIEVGFEEVTGINVPTAVDRGLNFAFAYLFAMTVNYSYYLKEIKGDNGWNPFKGILVTAIKRR